MKVIIDNKLYDTWKSIELCNLTEKTGSFLFGYEKKNYKLYITKKTKKFFKIFEDGKSESISNEDGKELLKKFNPKKYLKLFGEVEEA